MYRIVTAFSLMLLLLGADCVDSWGCEVSRLEISQSLYTGRRSVYVQDILTAYDSAGLVLWTHPAPFQRLDEFQPLRMADAWLENSATDTTIILYLTDQRFQVFDCTEQSLRNVWFSDRLPQYGWEMSTGYQMADSETLRLYGADHVGRYLRAFAIDVPISAMLDSTLAAVPDSLISTRWAWPTKPGNAVWDEFQVARLDFNDSTLVLKTGYYNPYYDGEWEPLWLVNAQYNMDPDTGEWLNTPCLKGDANHGNSLDAGDRLRILNDLLDYSRGRNCRDPSTHIEECRVDVNSDGQLDIEDVVDVFLLVEGLPVPPSNYTTQSVNWEFVSRAPLDSLSSVDRVTLQIAGADTILGYHLRFEGPLPAEIVTAGWMQSVDGESDGCPVSGAPVEIIAATDSTAGGGSLLTLSLPADEFGEFPESILVKEGLAIGPGGVRYEWPEHMVQLATSPASGPPPSARVELRQNHPNPFNPSTTIEYLLPSRLHVRLDVYDLSGRHVRRLVDEVQPEGENSTSWDGRDKKGHRVTSGVYLYRIHTDSGDEVRKMALLK